MTMMLGVLGGVIVLALVSAVRYYRVGVRYRHYEREANARWERTIAALQTAAAIREGLGL